MTRALPSRPDIKHLRKEAKQLYIRLHRQAPEAQLADAQFILAAEYGFKSWGRLKTEVERRNAERWTARLTQQEAFHPPVLRQAAPAATSHRIWFQETADEAEAAPALFLQSAGLQLAILLMLLSLALLGLR